MINFQILKCSEVKWSVVLYYITCFIMLYQIYTKILSSITNEDNFPFRKKTETIWKVSKNIALKSRICLHHVYTKKKKGFNKTAETLVFKLWPPSPRLRRAMWAMQGSNLRPPACKAFRYTFLTVSILFIFLYLYCFTVYYKLHKICSELKQFIFCWHHVDTAFFKLILCHQ